MEHGKYVTELFADKALDYLDELAESEEPFYLAVNFTAPHAHGERSTIRPNGLIITRTVTLPPSRISRTIPIC